jgi:hypothetical protein
MARCNDDVMTGSTEWIWGPRPGIRPGSTPHANAIELISEDESAAAAHHQSLPVIVLSLVVDRACSTHKEVDGS